MLFLHFNLKKENQMLVVSVQLNCSWLEIKIEAKLIEWSQAADSSKTDQLDQNHWQKYSSFIGSQYI